MATEKTVEAVSSQRLPSWGWQMQGNGIVAPVPLFSIAASSGFSSSTSTAPSATFPSNPQINSVQNPLLPLPTTSTSNTNDSNYFTYRRSWNQDVIICLYAFRRLGKQDNLANYSSLYYVQVCIFII